MTIAETAKKFDLTPDTLRYYERIGLIPPVPRTSGGNRNYDETSCNWIEFIKCMRSAGLSIDALVEYVSLFAKGNETIGKRKEILICQRDQLISRMRELEDTLQRLNYKIDHYEELSL